MKRAAIFCAVCIIAITVMAVSTVRRSAAVRAGDGPESKYYLPLIKRAFGLDIAPFISDIRAPAVITDMKDPGDGRLFITTRDGRILVSDADGTLQPDLLLDIRDRVRDDGNEAGLLGLAVHPDFASNGRIYVYYITSSGSTYLAVVAQYTIGEDGTADPASEQRLLSNEVPSLRHNAGAMQFGPQDGYLYIATGDGGTTYDRAGNAQSRQSLLGKVLRIDVDSAEPYAIPPDNPFVDDASSRGEIWAYGLRNPWRFSFDRLTGDMYIGDVGENAWEEIDFIRADSGGGENFGWPCREGPVEFPPGVCDEGLEYVDPIFAYPQQACAAVIGGYVYRGSQLPEVDGHFFFSDVCDGDLQSLKQDDNQVWQSFNWGDLGQSYTTFGERFDGEILLGAYDHTVYQLIGPEKPAGN